MFISQNCTINVKCLNSKEISCMDIYYIYINLEIHNILENIYLSRRLVFKNTLEKMYRKLNTLKSSIKDNAFTEQVLKTKSSKKSSVILLNKFKGEMKQKLY